MSSIDERKTQAQSAASTIIKREASIMQQKKRTPEWYVAYAATFRGEREPVAKRLAIAATHIKTAPVNNNCYYYINEDDAKNTANRCEVAVLFRGRYEYRRCTNRVAADGDARQCVEHHDNDETFIHSGTTTL